jgi:hypothetical protein
MTSNNPNITDKILKTIKSCKTIEHLGVCRNYINLYYKINLTNKQKIETEFHKQSNKIFNS